MGNLPSHMRTRPTARRPAGAPLPQCRAHTSTSCRPKSAAARGRARVCRRGDVQSGFPALKTLCAPPSIRVPHPATTGPSPLSTAVSSPESPGTLWVHFYTQILYRTGLCRHTCVGAPVCTVFTNACVCVHVSGVCTGVYISAMCVCCAQVTCVSACVWTRTDRPDHSSTAKLL